jgi:transcriptional regulator with XRE-family HTH domain
MSATSLSQPRAARKWREAHGWSREQLAARIGFSASTIQNYEAGKVRDSGKRLGTAEWRRYRNACAAVHFGLEFDWQCDEGEA